MGKWEHKRILGIIALAFLLLAGTATAYNRLWSDVDFMGNKLYNVTYNSFDSISNGGFWDTATLNISKPTSIYLSGIHLEERNIEDVNYIEVDTIREYDPAGVGVELLDFSEMRQEIQIYRDMNFTTDSRGSVNIYDAKTINAIENITVGDPTNPIATKSYVNGTTNHVFESLYPFYFNQNISANGTGFIFGDVAGSTLEGKYVFGSGFGLNISGDYGTAFGGETTSGKRAFAAGFRTEATGQNSVAMGTHTEATNYNTVAMGANTEAHGWSSYAGGAATKATGYCGFAFGYHDPYGYGEDLIAAGEGSVAMGRSLDGNNLSAAGDASFALGENVNALQDNSYSLGKNFDNNVAESFAVGFEDKTLHVGDNWVNVTGLLNASKGTFGEGSEDGVTIAEGSRLRIGSTSAYPTNADIRFGDEDYARIYESADDEITVKGDMKVTLLTNGGSLNLDDSGNVEVDTLNFNGNAITDSTGTIDFDDEDMVTAGKVSAKRGNFTGYVNTTWLNASKITTPGNITISRADSGFSWQQAGAMGQLVLENTENADSMIEFRGDGRDDWGDAYHISYDSSVEKLVLGTWYQPADTFKDMLTISYQGAFEFNPAGFESGGILTAYAKPISGAGVTDVYTAVADLGGGSGQVGDGLGYLFRIEDGSGVREDVGKFEYYWATPTDGSENSVFAQKLMSGGSMTDMIVSNGSSLSTTMSGSVAVGDNLPDGLSAGDINVSTIYRDAEVAKSPAVLCSRNKCKVEDLEAEKTYYVEKDSDWNIVSIRDTRGPVDAPDKIADKFSMLADREAERKAREACEGRYEDGQCYELRKRQVTYEQATIAEQVPVMENAEVECRELDEELRVITTTCMEARDTGETETQVTFRDGCGWDGEYYCIEKAVAKEGI